MAKSEPSSPPPYTSPLLHRANSFVLWMCIGTEHHPCSLGSLSCNKSLQHCTRAEQHSSVWGTSLMLFAPFGQPCLCPWQFLLLFGCPSVLAFLSNTIPKLFTGCSQGPGAISSSLPSPRECAATAELHSEYPGICGAWAEISLLNCSAVSA